MRLSGNGQISLERSGTIVKAFRGFSAFWGPRKISIAPNQHHPLTDLLEKPGNTAPPLLPSAFSHIHSKTACRGFKSFCPCQKWRGKHMLISPFFVSGWNVLATRHGCAPRSACRGALVAGGDRPAPTEAAAETSPSHDFLLDFLFFPYVLPCPQPFPSPPAPGTHPTSAVFA